MLSELSRHTDFGHAVQAGLLDRIEFADRLVDILALLPEAVALLLDLLHQKFQLPDLARRLVVDLDDLANLRDGEADPPAAQDLRDQCRSAGR